MWIKDLSDDVLDEARRIREDLHRHPESSLQEERTAGVVAGFLEGLGLDEVRTGVAKTGVVALLRGARDGRTVALRADMDALPITEETGLPYASENRGFMHACGHDGHTAILLGVARVLAGRRDELPGSVKFIFQPAEENLGGGALMVKEGCLEEPRPDAIFALHCSPGLKVGQIALHPLPNVGMANFRIDIHGKGGHASSPHSTVDPIVIGSHIVTAAQTIVSRKTRPDRPVVISFCTFRAGSASNIIPETAALLGTLRATDMETLKGLSEMLQKLSSELAAAMDGEVEFTEGETYPPLHNDPDLLGLIRRVGEEVLGSDNVRDRERQVMGSEDFAFYLESQGGVPGVKFSLGVDSPASLHGPHFDFGHEALEPGILMMCNTAVQFLERGASERC